MQAAGLADWVRGFQVGLQRDAAHAREVVASLVGRIKK